MTRPTRFLGASLLAALALAACGGDPAQIRAETAARLQEDLDKVAVAIDAGQCGRSVDAPLERLDRDVGNLDDIDGGVQGSLQDGVDRLAELAQQECDDIEAAEEEAQTTTPETTTETTTTTEPETTTESTTTEPETTTSTTTTTTPTEPSTSTTPPEAPTTVPEPGGQAVPEDGGATPDGGDDG